MLLDDYSGLAFSALGRPAIRLLGCFSLAVVSLACSTKTIRKGVDAGMDATTSGGGTGSGGDSGVGGSSGSNAEGSSMGGTSGSGGNVGPNSGGMGGSSSGGTVGTGTDSGGTGNGVGGAGGDPDGGMGGDPSTSTEAGETGGAGGTTTSAGGSNAGGTGGSGGTGTTSSCPATHECVPRPPEGWNGPVIFGDASTLTCSGNYPNEAIAGGLGVTGDRTCNCTCSATPTSSSCTLTVTEYSFSANCTGSGSTRNLNSAAVCQSFSSSPSAGLLLDGPTATCAAGGYAELPSPAFEDAVRACDGATEAVDACSGADEVCLPNPPEALGLGLCIYGDGLLSCPEQYPNEAALVFTQLNDTRSCPASCSCSAAGGDCSANANVYGVFDCTGGATTVSVGSQSQTCVTSGGALIPLGVSVNPQPTCSPDASTTTATGQVSGASPVTVCCRD